LNRWIWHDVGHEGEVEDTRDVGREDEIKNRHEDEVKTNAVQKNLVT
jgi:hypothetical protein